MSVTKLFDEPDAPKITDLLARCDAFAELPEAVLDALAEISERRRYGSGEAIYSLGQYDGSEVLVVEDGVIRASILDGSSGAMVFERYPSGSIYGLAAAIAGSVGELGDRLSITADTSVCVVAIDAAGLLDVVTQRPTLTRGLMHHFARQLAGGGLSPVAADASPESRLYKLVLELVEKDAVHGDWRIAKMPKHRELSERAGVDEALAASAIAQLIQDGVARREYPGLVIESMAELNRLAN